jgi:beta-lactamase regulating signal transducer with metallopeptidase domain
MIAFIAYVSAISLLLVAAATASEPLFGAIRQPTRSAWLAAVFGAVIITLVTLGVPHRTPHSASSGASTRAGETDAPFIVSLPSRDDASLTRGPSNAIVLAGGSTPTKRETAAATPRATLVAAGCWLVASVGCLVWLLVGTRRIDRLRRSCRPARLCGEHVLVAHGAGPAVLGVFRHWIIVPAWVEELDEDAQRLILAHEREHVRARDPLALHSVIVLVALMPWNIAFWFALHRLRAAIEIDCDTRVLRAERSPTRDYCQLLLEVGERTIAASSPLLALAEPATLLERRIESMTTSRKLWDWKTLVPAAGALMLLAGACRAPRPEIGPARWPVGMTRVLSSAMARGAGAASPGAAPGAAAVQAPVPAVKETATIRGALDSTHSSRTVIVPPIAVNPSASAQAMDTTVRNEEALRQSAAEHQARIDAIADSVILASYPELTRRPAGTHAFLAIVLDDRGRVMRHASSLDPALPNDLAAIMLALHVDTISARTIGLGISDDNRWKVVVGHAVEALGPVRGRTEMRASMTSPRPYALRRVPYQRIVDSVARARTPEAYQEHEGTFAIAMMLDEAGHVTRYGAEPHADLSAQSGRTPELMNRLVGDSTRAGDIVGVTSHLRPSRTVIVWGVRH